MGPLVQQAELLAAQYDAVVANPPYMGSKYQAPTLKRFAKNNFPDSKSDLFTCFIDRGYSLAKPYGFNSMVTMQSWMFLSSFQTMRERLLTDKTIVTMAHLGARAFGSISGEIVQTTSVVLRNQPPRGYRPVFLRLLSGGEEEKRSTLARGGERFDATPQDEFKGIPGSPVAYWVTEAVRNLYSGGQLLREFADPKQGMATTDNAKYLRQWWEVCLRQIGFGLPSLESALQAKLKWFPYNKGGSFRKWAGNREFIVDWENDGEAIKQDVVRKYPYLNENVGFVLKLTNPYFEKCLTWSATSSSHFGIRHSAQGMMFDVKGSSCFCREELLLPLLGFLASNITSQLLQALNPTIEFQNGNLKNLPIGSCFNDADFLDKSSVGVRRLVDNSNCDWDAYERSWDFQSLAPPDGLLRSHAHPRIQLHRLDQPEQGHHRRDEAPRRGEQPPLHRCLRPGRRAHSRRPH